MSLGYHLINYLRGLRRMPPAPARQTRKMIWNWSEKLALNQLGEALGWPWVGQLRRNSRTSPFDPAPPLVRFPSWFITKWSAFDAVGGSFDTLLKLLEASWTLLEASRGFSKASWNDLGRSWKALGLPLELQKGGDGKNPASRSEWEPQAPTTEIAEANCP